MHKRNYEKAAKIVQSVPPMECGIHRKTVEDAFVELFQNDNPRFDEERFRFACNREVK